MKRAFTLIELIVAIAIIAILAAVIAPQALKAIEKAKMGRTVAEMKAIKAAAKAYYVDVGKWPWNGVPDPNSSVNPTGIGFVDDDDADSWDGPYLEKWPTPPQWGTDKISFAYGYTETADWDGNGINPSHYLNLGACSVGGWAIEPFAKPIPQHIKEQMDTILDNGNLNTGRMRLTMGFHISYCLID